MQHTPYRPPPGLLVAGAIVILVPIVGAGAWLWLQWEALSVALPTLALVLRILFVVAPPTYALAFVWQRWGRTRYIDAHHITQQTRARVQIAPMAQHYHHEMHAVASEPPALLAPELDVIKPMAEWMAWIDEQPHSLLGGRTKSPPHLFDNDCNGAVISPEAGVAPVATVALSAAEIANIASLLMTLPTSEVVKKVDGYNGRNYREIRVKVDAVKSLIEGGNKAGGYAVGGRRRANPCTAADGHPRSPAMGHDGGAER